MGSPPPISGHLPPDPENITVEFHRDDPSQKSSSNRKNTTFYNSFPNSPNESRQELPTYDDLSTDEEAIIDHQSVNLRSQADVEVLPTHNHDHGAHSSARHAIHRLLLRLNRLWLHSSLS